MVLGGAAGVLAGVTAGVDAALAVETWRLGSGEVAELVTGLAREEARLAAARLRALAEAEQRRVGAGSGYLSTGAWYAAATRARARDAGPVVDLATALSGALAPTGEALAAGELSEAHAGVIARVMPTVTRALVGGSSPPPASTPGCARAPKGTPRRSSSTKQGAWTPTSSPSPGVTWSPG